MDTLTTVALAIAAFLVLIMLTAMEFKNAAFMHAQGKVSSPQRNTGDNGCNSDKNEYNIDENECNDNGSEIDDVTQDKEK